MKAQPVGHQQGLIIVVIEGDRDPKWRLAWSVLKPCDTLFRVPTIKAAEKLVRAGVFPDIIVFFQDHAFQFCEHDWLSFLAHSPLTQALLVFTDWCEAEPRTGAPLPGVIRIHWLRWLNRGRELISKLRQQCGDLWGLPPTASEEQRLLAEIGRTPIENMHPSFSHIGVITPSREGFSWIQQVALPFAQYISWIHATDGHLQVDSSPDLLIIDTWAELTTTQNTIDTLRASAWPNLPPFVPCIVLANFPRWEMAQNLIRGGNARLLAKPLLLTDLESVLSELATIDRGRCST